jgi:hypothetical protein
MAQQGSNVSNRTDMFPEWISWHSKKTNLPASYHSEEGFTKFLASLKNNVDNSYSSRELYALAVGLAFRDITLVLRHPGQTNSPLGVNHVASFREFVHPRLEEDQLFGSK